uniref:Uncharacterized protein n=1 Tax=Arundo donax TaxID=35708 RepID=A0A0A9HCY8_ARUDO
MTETMFNKRRERIHETRYTIQ